MRKELGQQEDVLLRTAQGQFLVSDWQSSRGTTRTRNYLRRLELGVQH